MPVAASSAKTLLSAAMLYITPSITIGVACRPCVIVPGWWTQAMRMFFTLVLLICASGLKRHAL